MVGKHTPGPWKWDTGCSFRRLSAKGDGDVLSPVVHRDGMPDILIVNGGADGPDARIIAAAPDLLEALQACADWMEALRACSNWKWQEGDEYMKARAAIAKARGE